MLQQATRHSGFPHAPAQVYLPGAQPGYWVKLAYMQIYANESNSAWALSQEPGRKGRPSILTPTSGMPGMPLPQLGLLKLEGTCSWNQLSSGPEDHKPRRLGAETLRDCFNQSKALF